MTFSGLHPHDALARFVTKDRDAVGFSGNHTEQGKEWSIGFIGR
jgi:hypothetical protein